MATTQITVAAFQDACAECADALADGDIATATTKYAVAEAINSGLDVEGSAGEFRNRRREALTGLKNAIDALEAALAQTTDSGRRLITTRTRHTV